MSDAPTTPTTNAAATSALLTALSALLFGWFCGLFFPLGVAAIVLGVVGIGQARSGAPGRGRAIAGIALGALALISVPLISTLLTLQ